MENKICTDLEQSRRLKSLGIDINTADMYYYTVNGKSEWYKTPNVLESMDDLDMDGNSIPAWSLSALLNILHSIQGNIPSLSGGGYKDGNYISDWCLDYEYDNGDYQKTFADNPIDACVEAIVKLHKQKLL